MGRRYGALPTVGFPGDQKAVVDTMQTRMELYDYLSYHEYEQKLDSLFAQGKNK